MNGGPISDRVNPGHVTPLQQALARVNQRLLGEADLAIQQVQDAIAALKSCDREAAQRVRRADDIVDREEVDIEEDCLKILALHKPVAIDLRRTTLILKVNEDLERIADHASGVAKAVSYLDKADKPVWPPALIAMTEEIHPVIARAKRALTDESKGASRELIAGDRTLNKLAKKVFEQVEAGIAEDALSERAGLLAYRASRDLERIGDLCVDIAEDILYFRTGEIVRHTSKDKPPKAAPQA
ncbi:MAG: phosphate signaling complex protein PhoU [Phycisphaeraceae bacterium]|nr:phosphate signaling complex protein PhoU [Phycisphaeraceae bacterium]